MTAEDFRMLELRQLIKLVGQLPISPPYILNSANEQYILLKYRESSAILEPWLRRLILFETIPLTCTQEDFGFFKPLAEFYRALLDLCLELQTKNPITFSDPYMAWFLAVTSKVQENLDFSLSVGSSLSYSKAERVKSDRQLIRAFEELSVSEEGELTTQKIILLEAQKIAQRSDNFYKATWKPFLKSWRKYVRSMERCKQLQVLQATPDGGVYIGGNGRNILSGICTQEEIANKCNGIVTNKGLGFAK